MLSLDRVLILRGGRGKIKVQISFSVFSILSLHIYKEDFNRYNIDKSINTECSKISKKGKENNTLLQGEAEKTVEVYFKTENLTRIKDKFQIPPDKQNSQFFVSQTNMDKV